MYASTPPVPSSNYYPANPKNVFGTRIPSSVCFAVGLILFLMPFAEFRCKPPAVEADPLFAMMKIRLMASNSGLGLATGSKWKFNTPTSTMLPEEKAVAWTKDIKKQDPNIYAIAAMALAILGLILSLSNNRLAVNGAIACGALSAISLIGLMIDLKRKSKDFMKEINETSDSYDVGEYTQINLVFTPWSYVCTIALLTAAFLSYRRLKLLGNRSTTS